MASVRASTRSCKHSWRLRHLSSHLCPIPTEAQMEDRHQLDETVDAVIVGSGFSGMCLKFKLRQAGITRVRTYEKGGDVGGTWYWNHYPGAACDIESHSYSYSFSPELEQEWSWSRRYGRQPEILDYAKFTASKFDLRNGVRFWTEVTSATYDEQEKVWVVRTNKGDRTKARFMFMANGPLSAPAMPNIHGVHSFEGLSFHTHNWNHEADLTGKHVGVIGTGSSATQCIPELAKVVKHLTVFQRTAAWCAPRLDASTDPDKEREIKANYKAFRLGVFTSTRGQQAGNAGLTELEKAAAAEEGWREAGGFGIALGFGLKSGDTPTGGEQYTFGPLNNPKANQRIQEHLRRMISRTVANPEVCRALTPKYPVACKRLCITDDYWPTFNRENVTLVDLGGRSITEITAAGPVGPDGTQYKLDVLVYATGFDAMTGALGSMAIRGSKGRSLEEKWKQGPLTYLGMLTEGFPNMFIMVGPQSPSVLANMLNAIEHQADWMCRLLRVMRSNELTEVDVDAAAEREWVRHCADMTSKTVWGGACGSCRSWYSKANMEGGSGDVGGRAGAVDPHQNVLPYTGGILEYATDVRRWGHLASNLEPPPKGLIFSRAQTEVWPQTPQ